MSENPIPSGRVSGKLLGGFGVDRTMPGERDRVKRVVDRRIEQSQHGHGHLHGRVNASEPRRTVADMRGGITGQQHVGEQIDPNLVKTPARLHE